MKVRVEIELDIPSFLIEAAGGDPIEQIVDEHVVRTAEVAHLQAVMKFLVEKAKAEDKGLTVVGPEVWSAMANGRKHWAAVMSEAKTRVIVLD